MRARNLCLERFDQDRAALKHYRSQGYRSYIMPE
jgi:hypothetical protein